MGWCRVYLLGYELRELWIAVTEGINGYATREIQVSPVLDVEEIASFSFLHHWWRLRVRSHQVWCILLDEGGRLRVWAWVGTWQRSVSLRISILAISTGKSNTLVNSHFCFF